MTNVYPLRPENEPYLDREAIAAHMGVTVGTIDRWLKETPPIPSEKWGPAPQSPRRFRASLCVAWARERAHRKGRS